jgi:predicted dehydrogenase
MAALATQSGLPNAVNFQSRYVAAHQFLREIVADGYLGEIRLVVVTAFAGYALDPQMEPHYATWASMASEGGGFLASALAHSLDLAQYLFGPIEAIAVTKQTAIRRKPRLAWDFLHDDPLSESSPTNGTSEVTGDDTAVVQGRLAGGGVMIVAGSWAVSNGSGTRLEAYGSEGTLTLAGSGDIAAARGNRPLEPLPVPENMVQRGGSRKDVPRLFAAMASDVVAAMRGEEPPSRGWPFATFRDGLAVQRIISAAGSEIR